MKLHHATLFVIVAACAQQQPPPPAVAQWDDAAAQEARAAWDQMTRTMERGDVDAARASIADDGFLGAYDLDMESKPIAFATRDEAVKFMETMIGETKKAGGTVRAQSKTVDCRATATYAVCRGEVDFSVTMGGQTMTQPSRVTGALRKGNDGWKWTHWHASLATAPAAPKHEVATMNTVDLKWEAPPGARPGAPPGVTTAVVWGDPAKGPHAAFVRLPKGTALARHYHSSNLWTVMLEGSMTVTNDGKAGEVKARGYHLQPGKVPHTTEAKAGAMFFQVADGPFDLVPVDDKGNPLPPAK